MASLASEYSSKDYRTIFNQPVGMVLSEFANLTQEQIDNVLDIQTKMVALDALETAQEKKTKTNLFNINIDEINNIPTESKSLEVAKAEVGSKKIKSRDVPVFGDLAVKMGYINPAVKDAVLSAQAAERIVQAYEGNIGFLTGVIKSGFESKDSTDRNFSRPYIGNDTPAKTSLQQAQAVNHLADIVTGFLAAQKKDVDSSIESKDNDALLPVNNAKNTLLGLGIHYYTSAGENIKRLGILDAGAAVDTVVAKLSEQQKGVFHPDRSIEILKTGLNSIISHYKKSGPEQFANSLEGIIDTRLQQAGLARIVHQQQQLSMH